MLERMTTSTPRPQTQSDPLEGKIIYVLIMTLMVQFLYPLSSGDSLWRTILFQLFYVALFLAGIYMVGKNKVIVRSLIIATIAWIVIGTLGAMRPDLQWANVVGYLLIIFFQLMLTYVLMRFAFRASRVSRDVLLAAITIYLLLGAVFVPVYGLIETFTWFPDEVAHAFIDGQNTYESLAIPWQTFVYYSYATLTTLGYGDIVPVTHWARSAATLEAVIGVLYTAIIMARLVGLYAGRDVGTETVSGPEAT